MKILKKNFVTQDICTSSFVIVLSTLYNTKIYFELFVNPL